MSVNGITTNSQAYSSVASSTAANTTSAKKEEETKTKGTDTGVVYESSKETSTAKTYKQDTKTIEKLKADAERSTEQLRSLVEKLLLKQGETYDAGTDIYKLLREGKVQVDEQTAAQAKKDIAEDGYWGVEQTSDRIVSFAIALSGGDPDKADEMISAFQKGYEDATKSWGDELPDISKRTYEATMKKLDDWKKGNQPGSTEDSATSKSSTEVPKDTTSVK
ncbi:MAG TPA: hypothetical protein VHP81_11875 [Lachnospiraceae bacterium]|nr:hypothetical protein [Lachnospiraceae bacterium]